MALRRHALSRACLGCCVGRGGAPFETLRWASSARRYPYVTGTSVLAIKYADGVMVASDMLGVHSREHFSPRCLWEVADTSLAARHAGAYGATKRYKSVERIKVRLRSTLCAATSW